MTRTALRTSLIWHDEVMSDVVSASPRKITLGHSARSTFVVPDLGLPANFAIVRPRKGGHLLTLGEHMRGTICIGGREREVADVVRSSDDGDKRGGFHATPISGRDWGVIHLDAEGTCKLFFQFVPVEEPQRFFTPGVTAGGFGGFLLTAAAMTLRSRFGGHAIDESIAIGVAMALAITAIGALAWWAFVQDNEQKAALAFSLVLHIALLFATFQLRSNQHPFVWPGARDLSGQYLVTRLTAPPEPEKPPPTLGAAKQQAAAAASQTPKKPTATKGDEGRHGGKGDVERARDPNAKDVPPEPPKVAFFEDRNRKMLDNIIDRDLQTNLGKFTGIKGETLKSGGTGFGKGTGTGVGDGLLGTGTTIGSKKGGSGGGGNVEGDFTSHKGPIDTGTQRPGGNCVGPNCKGNGPREVKVAVGEMSGDPGGLTAEEINRVVKARAGVFRACYQKELNRSPGIGGKLVIKFKIDGAGVVQDAAPTGGSSLANDAVASCVSSNVMRLKFPAKGGIANVTYPFVFSPGG